jgi:hypothetical protein
MRRGTADRVLSAFAALALAVFIVGSCLIWTKAPCGLWTFAKAGEMPARCIAEVVNHK